jgi:hypothetical protein
VIFAITSAIYLYRRSRQRNLSYLTRRRRNQTRKFVAHHAILATCPGSQSGLAAGDGCRVRPRASRQSMEFSPVMTLAGSPWRPLCVETAIFIIDATSAAGTPCPVTSATKMPMEPG